VKEKEVGYWKYNDKTYMGYIVCSDCGRNINITNPETVCYYANQMKFCPYCGKKKDKNKMREERDFEQEGR